MIPTRFLLILFSVTVIWGCKEKQTYTQQLVLPQYKDINHKDDIRAIDDSLVKPVIYTQVMSLEKLPIPEKKRKFIEMLLPAILVARHELKQEINRLSLIEEMKTQGRMITHQDSLFLNELHSRYKTYEIDILKQKLQPHPTSIVLGQAALESGWGTSRFFYQANNIFGIWSFTPKENRIKALYSRDSGSIFVKKYNNIEESIKDYYGTIARVNAYKEFREQRILSNNPVDLVPLLKRYSELGEDYTEMLMSLIRKNQLTLFDSYQIDPQYIEEKIVQVN